MCKLTLPAVVSRGLLLAVHPDRVRVVDGDRVSGALRDVLVLGHGLEARVEAALLQPTGVGEGRLGDRVVLGVEVEGDLVADGGVL